MKHVVKTCLSILIILATGSVLIFLSCGKSVDERYTIKRLTIDQPVDHNRKTSGTIPQEIQILLPEKADKSDAVFFHLGNESDQTEKDLVSLYRSYGSPERVIFIQAEHRGYGQSITGDEDQSVPAYVTVDQALADMHHAITVLKKTYTGPWIVAGYSYGGGLVIEFGTRYPGDMDAILSSSGVIDWSFTMEAYDRKVRKHFSEQAYQRLARHAANLAPEKIFDESWTEREFYIAMLHGVSQYGQYASLRSLVSLLSHLPTGAFMKLLHLMDNGFSGGAAWMYAYPKTMKKLTREQALTGDYNWRVWRYQQCHETGVFEVSADKDGIFRQTAEDYVAECRAGFPGYKNGDFTQWKPAAKIDWLRVPLVYVRGGNDPWVELGLPGDYHLKKGTFINVPEGYHCPDKHDPELGKRVLELLLALAR